MVKPRSDQRFYLGSDQYTVFAGFLKRICRQVRMAVPFMQPKEHDMQDKLPGRHPWASSISIAAALSLLAILIYFFWIPASDQRAKDSSSPESTAADAAVMTELPGVVSEQLTDDLPAMRERKVIRALVVPSLTDFFSLDGRIRGVQAEMLQNFEKHLNADIQHDELKTRIVYVPVAFNELIPALLEGRGDIAAAIITDTAERRELVDLAGWKGFTFNEVVVHSEDVEGIGSIDDLAGRTLYVLNDSAYAEHLEQLNLDFRQRGLEQVDIIEADPHLTTEDILELVNAGLVEITISDEYKADLWKEVLPDIRVRNDITLKEDRNAGWAVRPDNPKLAAAIEAASRNTRKGTLLGNILLNRYFDSTQWVNNPLARDQRQRFREHADLFRKYGEQYGFDWIALIAQAYQESGLDHSRQSPAGAVGIMQLLPSTAADPNVGIENIQTLENNVHAGAKYMSFLKDRYFADESLEDIDRLAFTWAAYNAGPRKVRIMRSHAGEMGLDPNQWFGNVEYAALDIIGQETVRYVANIYKYYVAYRLSSDLLEARESARTTLYEGE